jgi:hypothetical protein
MAGAAAGLLLHVKIDKDLRTRYGQLRVMLHGSGLAATYAFVAAKSGTGNARENAYRKVGRGICDRLAARGLLTADPETVTPAEMLTVLSAMGATEYARASADIAALFGWLSRLADATFQADQADERDQANQANTAVADSKGSS